MKKIIIVDDEPSVRKTLRILLSKKGYEITEAKSGDEAWDMVQKDKPDLMLLDIMMPGITPAELIKKIKADSNLKSIKIIYLTAVMGAKEMTKKVQGVIATLEKPFKNAELLEIIEKALK